MEGDRLMLGKEAVSDKQEQRETNDFSWIGFSNGPKQHRYSTGVNFGGVSVGFYEVSGTWLCVICCEPCRCFRLCVVFFLLPSVLSCKLTCNTPDSRNSG